MYLVVDKEHHAVLDISSVQHSSPTLYYVEATQAQVRLFHKLLENLPADHYPELHEVLNAKKAASTKTNQSERKATAATQKAIADLFKARNKERK